MARRARQAKGKARLSNYEALLAEASEQRVAALEIAVPPGPRLGDVVVEADHVTKADGDRVLVADTSSKPPRAGSVGVIGPNGAGKTTLFGMITGREKPDAGALRVGETVRLAYVDQSRDALDPAKTVWEAIGGGADTLTLGSRTVPSRAYVASFNFRGSDQQKRVADLSGGERNRLHRSEEHTSELQSRGHLVCRLLLEKKKKMHNTITLYITQITYAVYQPSFTLALPNRHSRLTSDPAITAPTITKP